MPIEYVKLTFNHINTNLIRIFIHKLTNLEKLQTNILLVKENFGNQEWNHVLWN
jgi:hypothetical protein